MTLCRLLGAGRLPLALSRWDPGRSECRASATSPVGVPARLGSSDARFAHVPGLQSMVGLGGPDRCSRTPSIWYLHTLSSGDLQIPQGAPRGRSHGTPYPARGVRGHCERGGSEEGPPAGWGSLAPLPSAWPVFSSASGEKGVGGGAWRGHGELEVQPWCVRSDVGWALPGAALSFLPCSPSQDPERPPPRVC